MLYPLSYGRSRRQKPTQRTIPVVAAARMSRSSTTPLRARTLTSDEETNIVPVMETVITEKQAE